MSRAQKKSTTRGIVPKTSWVYVPDMDDIIFAREEGAARNAVKLAANLHRRQYARMGPTDHDDPMPNILAVKAELAVAKKCGGEYVAAVAVQGQKTGNVRLRDGRMARVHYAGSSKYDLSLYTKTMTGWFADVYILVQPLNDGLQKIEDPVRLAGWVDRKTFEERSRLRLYGTRERLAVPASRLLPMDHLYGPEIRGTEGPADALHQGALI